MRSLSILFVFISFSASGQNWEWAVSAGGSQEDVSNEITLDGLGNIYVTGWFGSDTMFFEDDTIYSNGERDMFLSKYNSFGELTWVKSGGGTGNEWCYGITHDYLNNSYVVGTFEEEAFFSDTSLISSGGSDGFIIKYDSSGQLVWAKELGGIDYDGIYSITADSSGTFFITGWFSNTIIIDDTTLISSGGADIFIAKFDNTGKNIWAQKAGGFNFDVGHEIRLDNTSSSLFVTGAFQNEAIFSGSTLISNGDLDFFFVKYDTSGTLLWAKQGGSIGQDFPWDMDIGNDNSMYVSGQAEFISEFEGTILNEPAWVIIKYSNSGQLQWAKSIGYIGIGVDKSDNSFLSGNTKYDSAGTVLFVLPTDALNTNDFCFDADGSAYILGRLWETSSFDNVFLTSNGDIDVYLAKLNPSVTVSESKIDTFEIYPNPATSSITIELPASATFKNAELSIQTISGQVVFQSASALGGPKSAIDISVFSKGLYLIKVRAGDEVVVRKVVVE
jgi:hypothetical protein